MSDMITLGTLRLPNPVIASSGALEYGRAYPWERPFVWSGLVQPEILGALTTKTLTAAPRRGNWRGWNPWQVLRKLRGGWVNAIGLANPGIDWFIANEYQRVYHKNLIVSITGGSASDIVDMVRQLNAVEVLAVELNLSCPNSPEWIRWQDEPRSLLNLLEAVRLTLRHPLIVKIGYHASIEKRLGLSQVLRSGGVEIVAMINTIPFAQILPDRQSPLSFGGGVSGALIKRQALEQVSWFSQHTRFAIIGGGGVGTAFDVWEFLAAGAAAVSIGSAHILKPWVSTRLAKQFSNHRHYYRSASLP